MRSPLYYLTHWYTYRGIVGVVIALTLTGIFTWAAGQVRAESATVRITAHPEDRFFASSANSDTDPNVVIVGIDDRSIAAEGQFPFSRDRYATLLDNLHDAGAAVVAMDIQLSEPSKPDLDASLAAAIKRDGPVILAYGQTGWTTGDGHLATMANPGQVNRPLPQFLCGNATALRGCDQPVAQLGVTGIRLDPDGVERRIPMLIRSPCATLDAAGTCHPGQINTLSFAAYRTFVLNGNPPEPALSDSPAGLQFGGAWSRTLPVDEHGNAVVNYSGPPKNWQASGRFISFSDAVAQHFDRAKVDGKIVLVGAYGATGVQDVQNVPTGGDKQMDGIEIHANMIGTLLSQGQSRFLGEEPLWLTFLLLLILTVALGLLLPRLSAVYGLAATAVALIVFTVGWAAAQPAVHLVPDLIHTWLAIGLVYAGLMAYRFLYEEREKAKVKNIFGAFLKPELVEEITRKRSLGDIPLGGVRKDLSLLFVDIRGFTRMSESLEAERVLEVLNEYLNALTQTVFRWDGTLDKYVGDEIMALWNAPRDQDDHQLLAVRCAFEMISKNIEINQALRARELPPLKYGIGVNSGPASVGIMGSEGRRTYTAVGDTVNTAARFCGAAGAGQILIGEGTYQKVRDYVAVDLVPGVQLKGKSAEKFTIYSVTAMREAPGSPWVQVPPIEEVTATQAQIEAPTELRIGHTAVVEAGLETQVSPAGTATMVMPSTPQWSPASPEPSPPQPPQTPAFNWPPPQAPASEADPAPAQPVEGLRPPPE